MDGAQKIEYQVKITYDENKLNSMGNDWKEKLESDYINAGLEIDPEKGLIVLPSKKGLKVDVSSTLVSLPQEWNQSENILSEMVVEEETPRKARATCKNGEISPSLPGIIPTR